jgi:hypothetical protein
VYPTLERILFLLDYVKDQLYPFGYKRYPAGRGSSPAFGYIHVKLSLIKTTK